MGVLFSMNKHYEALGRSFHIFNSLCSCWLLTELVDINVISWHFYVSTVFLFIYTFVIFSDERAAIRSYFNLGLKYETILHFLAVFHGIMISIRTLKRRLQQYGLCHTGTSPAHLIDSALSIEFSGPGLFCFSFVSGLSCALYGCMYVQLNEYLEVNAWHSVVLTMLLRQL